MRNRNAYGAIKDITAAPQNEPSDAKVEAAAHRLFGATVDSMDRARTRPHCSDRLAAGRLPHCAPGKITFRDG